MDLNERKAILQVKDLLCLLGENVKNLVNYCAIAGGDTDAAIPDDQGFQENQDLQDVVSLALHNGWTIDPLTQQLHFPGDVSTTWAAVWKTAIMPDGVQVHVPHWIEDRMATITIDNETRKIARKNALSTDSIETFTVNLIDNCDLVDDVKAMHDRFGVRDVVKQFSATQLKEFLAFRILFLQEECSELIEAQSAENAVDALIDLVVVAIGTLDLLQVDIAKAWKCVHNANMAKQVGVNPNRPNPLGLPDLVKPEGWTAPNHAGNVGLFTQCFSSGESGV